MQKLIYLFSGIMLTLLFVFNANPCEAQVNLESGLILYYPLNGNADDLSGNDNHGTIFSPGVYPFNDKTGIDNSAMRFNGAFEQGMIECPENILNGLPEFSMSYWFNVSSFTNSMSLVGQDNNIETGFYTSPNRVAIWHPSGSTSVNISAEIGEWQHLVLTLDDTEMNIYLNGSLLNTINGDFSLITNSFTPRVGGNVVNQNNNNWLRGAVDEVRFYNRVLNQDEVNILSGNMPLTYGITNISNLSVCTESTIDVEYAVIGAGTLAGNTFSLQISDKFGSFDNPIVLAETTGNSSGIFESVEIPAYLPTGENYKLRLVGDMPIYSGTESSQNLSIINIREGMSTLEQNRILYYKFDSDALDYSGNDKHGTVEGGVSYIEDRFGNPFSAVQLNGTNGYIDVPQDVWFDGSPFSIATWVKPSAFNSWSRILDFGIGQGNENITFALTSGTSGNLYALIRRGTSTQFNVTGSATIIGEWSHAIFSFDGENIRIYLNGNLVASVESQAPRMLTRTTCYIGKSTVAGGNYANAAFDDFMIWNRQLTDDEIRVLANDGMIFSNSPVCDGNTISLSAPFIYGAAYDWTGPESFSSEQRNNDISNATVEMGGTYSLEISKASCISGVYEKQVQVVDNPSQATVSFTGLPETSYIGASAKTMSPTPAGGFFSGNGVQGNVFYPSVAGVGSHTIIYSYQNSGGCMSTAEQTISVGEAYLISNQTINVCGGGFYDSGGSDSHYSNNEDYTITFCSDNDERLRFYFSQMSIAAGDTLWAYNGSDTDAELIAMYIQNSNRDYIWSSGECLTFKFKSDDSGTANGWEAEFWCMENPVLENEITDMSTGFRTVCSGRFRDPGGSGNYPLGIERVQTFKSEDGGRLRLDFNLFDLNGNNGGHWLHVYDGPTASYPRIGSYSQWANPPSAAVQSSGEYLTFRFESVISVGARPGWDADWSCISPALPVILLGENPEPLCQAVIYDHAGPGTNYQENRHDVSVICSDNGELLRLLSNHNETHFGDGDSLKIYDGNSTDAPLIAIYIKGSRLDQVVSSGTCLTIEFISDETGNGRGWQTYLTCLSEAPSQISYNMSTGERFVCNAKFRDPGGTGDYPRGQWTQTYTSYSGDRLRMSRNSFNVNGNNGGHPFSVYDGPDTSAPLIGTYTNFANPPAVIQSSGSSLTFVFNSTNMSAGTTAGWDFDITCFSDEPIDVMWLSSPVCAGEEILVEYVLNETVNAGNVLTAQLSNANGEFTSPINIGTLESESSGNIIATIPSGLVGGIEYRIRVISSDPAMIGNQSPNNLIINPLPIQPGINITGSQELCPGDDVLLSVTPQDGVNYDWYKDESVLLASNQNSYIADSEGIYYVVASNSCAVVESINEVSVSEIDVPAQVIIATDDETDICEEESVLLYTDEISGVSYTWIKDGLSVGSDNHMFTALQEGIYSVELTNDCGTTESENQIEVTIIGETPEQAFIEQAGNSNSCDGDEVILSVEEQNDANYQWFKDGEPTGENSNILTVNESGEFTIIISNDCGEAESLNSRTIQFFDEPANFDIMVVGNTEICDGESVELQAPVIEHSDYQWFNDGINLGNNSNTLTVTESGIYSVIVQNICGSGSSNSPIDVVVHNQIDDFVISADGDTEFCIGGEVVLSTNLQDDVSYQWTKDGEPIGENSNTVIANESGEYSLIITNNCGSKESTNSIYIVIINPPEDYEIIINGETSLCEGESVVLSVPEAQGADYQWYKDGNEFGQNHNEITVNQSGIYTLHITNECGTTELSDEVEILVNPLPEVSYVQDPDIICFQWGSFILDGGLPEGGVYLGQGVLNGEIITSNAGVGTHEIFYTYTDENNCVNSASSFITIDDCTDISETTQNRFEIYPNPAKDNILILADNSGTYNLKIFNSLGQLVISETNIVINSDLAYQIEISGLVNGLYTIILDNEFGRVVKPFVVE
jgi:hypothetical protein